MERVRGGRYRRDRDSWCGASSSAAPAPSATLSSPSVEVGPSDPELLASAVGTPLR